MQPECSVHCKYVAVVPIENVLRDVSYAASQSRVILLPHLGFCLYSAHFPDFF